MPNLDFAVSFHDQQLASNTAALSLGWSQTRFTYTFENFFHPFVGNLIAKLKKDSLPGMLDAKWQDSIKEPFFEHEYALTTDRLVGVKDFPKEFDVENGPYANYNWELFFHIPLLVAVHLSKNQRFAEAQRWFHYIFDPTSNDQSSDPRKRFWKFLAFRSPDGEMRIEDIVRLLSIPPARLSDEDRSRQREKLEGYNRIRNEPFQPHVVARMRHLAYQYCVVMKYLDNLLAWGDHLFQQDTGEAINEATQIYVLAANILGERPQQIPSGASVKARTFAQLKLEGLGPVGDALVSLEGQFPVNLAAGSPSSARDGESNVLFGIGRTLYFCIPRNDKLLGYWDMVADRLFKVRHCMNIAGVVRPLALFDPPLDPAMLVKAAAAGIDIASIVSGLNQPAGPVRGLFLVQKALELCGEVRALGNALLAALEKGDAEHMALVRQQHEIQLQTMAQEVRFLQWKSAQESTTSLLTSRATALERLHYYQRLLGAPADANAPDSLPIDFAAVDANGLTEGNFDAAYNALVSHYARSLTPQQYPPARLAEGSSPEQTSGQSGSGRMYLSQNEYDELNVHLPNVRNFRLASSAANLLAAALMPIPSINVHGTPWGVGMASKVTGGEVIGAIVKTLGEISQIVANWEQDQAGMASRQASYERRADEWLLQYNLAAHELMQIGRQILTSLIAEQIAHREYLNIQQQIAKAQEVDRLLHEKFSNEDLYLWMQGELSRLYYEYYRFAFDTARRAEKTMKQELMRPELDGRDFVKFNYWDGGRKGLLAGEALYLDVKRLEMAFHDNNKRELELTRHVSLRQLDPLALLTLRVTGSCQFTIPEWLYDRDCSGHYMRRIKTVAVSIPSVVGPYASLNATLSLLGSSVRKSPIAGDYPRQGAEDDRFVDYAGSIQSIVTSSGTSDSGLFETNLRDERFLPFEGAGAISTWKVELPRDYRPFDYGTISDVILHVRYTARPGVDPTRVRAALDDLFHQVGQARLAVLVGLRQDFPTEWSAFVNGTGDFTVTLRKDYFPYMVQDINLVVDALEFYRSDVPASGGPVRLEIPSASLPGLPGLSAQLSAPAGPPAVLTVRAGLPREAAAQVFLIVRYHLA